MIKPKYFLKKKKKKKKNIYIYIMYDWFLLIGEPKPRPEPVKKSAEPLSMADALQMAFKKRQQNGKNLNVLFWRYSLYI